MKLISICIAVYQNAGSLRGLVDEIFVTFASQVSGVDFEIVFVNDGSTDGSSEVLQQLAREHPDRISVITFTRNFGQLFAIIAAIDAAHGDALINISADQQDPFSVAAKMVDLWKAGNEIVIAHRAAREDGFGAKLFSWLAYGLLRVSTPTLPKGGFDYFLLDRRPADDLRARRNRNRFFPTDILSLGYTVSFIPYTRQARVHGRSQHTFFSRLRSLIDAVVDSSYLPIRAMSVFGISFVIVGMLYAASVAMGRFFGTVPVGGFAVIVILLLTIGGLIILMLGILGEYVWRIYDELRGGPLYLVKTVAGPAARRLRRGAFQSKNVTAIDRESDRSQDGD